MTLSDRSLSMVKPSSLTMIALAMVSLISPAEAQVSCKSSSPQCCYVVQIWKDMNKTTSVSATSATACCYTLVSSTGSITTQSSGIPGVMCSSATSPATVIKLDWREKNLTKSIPSSIGNLVNLDSLLLAYNNMSGSIPPSIGNLVKLENLTLGYNQLNGSIPPEIGKLTKLTVFSVSYNQLSGTIPSVIGKLTNLETLSFMSNRFTGPIPADIGNLVKLKTLVLKVNNFTGAIPRDMERLTSLQKLYLGGNPNLYGPYKPSCSTKVSLYDTNVTICGCVSASTPPMIFPPPGTPDACLSTGHSMSLGKRILAFSDTIGAFKYTCNTDGNGNPYADCLNTMGKICNSTSPDFLVTRCKDGVDKMTLAMNSYWQAVRRECGQWPWNVFVGNKDSTNCANANTALQQNAIYTLFDGTKVKVTPALTDSIKVGLWNNTALRG